MDSVGKRFERLSQEYKNEVSDFIDFLLQKMESSQKPETDSTPKRSLFRSPSNVPTTPPIQNEPPVKPVVKPKIELAPEEKELDEAPELYPCPYCKCVVRKEWEECPFCNKKLNKKK